MPRLRATVDIEPGPEAVWDVIADFGGVYRWNPTVNSSHLTSERGSGVGTTRHCDLAMAGATVEERILDWRDGSGFTVAIFDKKRMPFVTDLVGSFSVEERGGGAEAAFEFEYRTTSGPIGRLMDRFVIRTQNRKMARLILAGLKHHVETGEEVGKEVRVDRDVVHLAEV